ncbi:hypothetical protein J3R30DRAFT_3424749 [Lentinula aciculospora]|uniref:MARVEL domain-containing protein n=1 Tax=Lentinula aciculospora TaxID=153920 RepID=A0A9W9DY87_9AGAR|nr:hypothetical protein J3R30DRAFT_3424749 [Lentinula aciculospora]
MIWQSLQNCYSPHLSLCCGMWLVAVYILLRKPNSLVSTTITGLVVIWFFWISGAAAVSIRDMESRWCKQVQGCQLIPVILAFAWLGCITLTVMLVLLIVAIVTSTRGLDEPPNRKLKVQ